MPSVKDAPRKYIVEMAVITAAYAALVVSRPFLVHLTAEPLLKTALTVSPALPIWVIFVAVIRFYRRVDEFQQRQLLETLSLCFGVSAAFMASYTFFEDAGAPVLSIVWIWPIMAAIWLLIGAVKRLRMP